MMRKLAWLLLLLISITASAQESGTIKISTKNNELIYKVGNNKRLYQSYMGIKMSDQNYPDKRAEAYATGGIDFEFEPAIRVVHADGNPSLELKYVKHNIVKNTDGSVQTDILLQDPVYATTVLLSFLSYPEQDVVKTWTTIKNAEKGEVVLSNYASAMLHFNASKYWLKQFTTRC
jgi:alpha-galactosidase